MANIKIAILGFGRFGKTLYKLLSPDFDIVLYDSDPLVFKDVVLNERTIITHDVAAIYECDVIFYCVPISAFEKIIASHKRFFKDQLLVDVLSVKEYPEKVFRKYLKGLSTRALLTHPMFGPDSSKGGFGGLTICLNRFLSKDEEYKFWKDYLIQKGLKVIELDPTTHDKMAANSHGVAHFIGRILQEFKFKPTEIDTFGVKKLHELMVPVCNDTWELFLNLQRFNPYTKDMRLNLENSCKKINNKILNKRINSKYYVYGIQGGRGSFNEEAINELLSKKNARFKIKYLYTSEGVLKALNKGEIDFGFFAITNSLAGIVEESISAVSKYNFKIIDKYIMKIRHFLMKRKDVPFDEINTIMAHPQVLKQCENTLKLKYPNLKLISGLGSYIDTSKATLALSKGLISKNTAILGPGGLSDLYNLDIVAKNLQDSNSNYTTFLLVGR